MDFGLKGKNAATLPISSGSAQRPSSVWFAIPERTWSGVTPRTLAIASARGPHDSTFVKPGQMLLTVMPTLPSSPAMSFENAMMPAFGIVVVNVPASSCLPVTPETLRIRPMRLFLRAGSACFVA